MDSEDLRDFYIKTVPYMFSDDFRLRIVAEYNQLQYRIIRLNNHINGPFLREADEKILLVQHKAMNEYRDALWHRILDLGIDHTYRGELIL